MPFSYSAKKVECFSRGRAKLDANGWKTRKKIPYLRSEMFEKRK
jgi:hypothetical protein